MFRMSIFCSHTDTELGRLRVDSIVISLLQNSHIYMINMVLNCILHDTLSQVRGVKFERWTFRPPFSVQGSSGMGLFDWSPMGSYLLPIDTWSIFYRLELFSWLQKLRRAAKNQNDERTLTSTVCWLKREPVWSKASLTSPSTCGLLELMSIDSILERKRDTLNILMPKPKYLVERGIFSVAKLVISGYRWQKSYCFRRLSFHNAMHIGYTVV